MYLNYFILLDHIICKCFLFLSYFVYVLLFYLIGAIRAKSLLRKPRYAIRIYKYGNLCDCYEIINSHRNTTAFINLVNRYTPLPKNKQYIIYYINK